MRTAVIASCQHKAPTPVPVEDPLPDEQPVPIQDPVPDHNPESTSPARRRLRGPHPG